MKAKYFLAAAVIAVSLSAGCETAEIPEGSADSSAAVLQEPANAVNSKESVDDAPSTSETLSESSETSGAEVVVPDTDDETGEETDEETIESEPYVSEAESESEETEPEVTGDWAENVDVDDYDEYVIDDSEYSLNIMFTANKPVTDFEVVSLFLEDVTEDGNPIYTTDSIYVHGDLSPDKPLMITVSFPGDMPNYGINYIDSRGELRRYALQQSGRDGSFVMFEYD